MMYSIGLSLYLISVAYLGRPKWIGCRSGGLRLVCMYIGLLLFTMLTISQGQSVESSLCILLFTMLTISQGQSVESSLCILLFTMLTISQGQSVESSLCILLFTMLTISQGQSVESSLHRLRRSFRTLPLPPHQGPPLDGRIHLRSTGH